MARFSLKRSGTVRTEGSGSGRFRITQKGAFFAVAALLGSVAALSHSTVNMLHTRSPAAALAINGDDPVALVRDAQSRIVAGDAQATSESAVLSVVQRSVQELPINGPALRLYGLNSAAGGGTNLATMRAQMEASDRMERRDVGAQLWLIESAVEQNDVNRALRHYDTALRIEESSRALLYPVMTDAMDSPLIRDRFLPYMAANPPWLESFLRYAVSRTDTPVSMARLAKANNGWPEGAAFSSLDTELLARLVSNNDFEEAVAHFQRIEGADPAILTTLALNNASTNWRLAPLAWQPFKIEGIETFILASPEGGGAVEIEAEFQAGFKGPVARKFMALKPGRYRVASAMRAEDFSRPDQMQWRLTCASEGQGSTLLSENVDFGEKMQLSGTLQVPAACPVQLLMVSANTLVTTRYIKLVLETAEITPLAR
ncbi:MAG: hypothetical protein SXU28_00640 [Pseudomonadota bacterium]|nr:hypothetical protein [Pseudomonadota bacterium]